MRRDSIHRWISYSLICRSKPPQSNAAPNSKFADAGEDCST
jgi:hypothetical protein